MPHTQPPHILLVNDDPKEIVEYRQEFSEAGYTVSCAESGQHAIAFLEDSTDPPDIVLSNIYMAEMNGFSLCDPLRELLPAVVVIAIPASATDPVYRTLIQERFDGVVAKPLNLQELETLIHSLDA